MNFNPRIIEISDMKQSYQELTKIGCDPVGIHIMGPKAVFKVMKVECISVKAANLLKQTFLAKGGEVAVSRDTAGLTAEQTDVLIFATLKQYRKALTQLQQQPWGLPELADAMMSVLAAQDSPIIRDYDQRQPVLQITPGRTLVMGILNVTPDSFSDGGRYNDRERAVEQVAAMVRDGADIIDIGAESTRPYGAKPITAVEEMDRLLPLLRHVLAISPVPISVDTYKAEVADAALQMGAHLINDIWGLQGDPQMASVVAKHKVPVVIMHNQVGTHYEQDIMGSLCHFLQRGIQVGRDAGIAQENFIVDPGIGFGKTLPQNLTVMARLAELHALGCPVLAGTSRKRFIGEVLALPVEERLEGTAATVALAITKGVHIVRVHDVKTMSRIAKMTDSMRGRMNDE